MKRRYPIAYIAELEKTILTEIIRTKRYQIEYDQKKVRESAETLLTLAQAWDLLTRRGVE